MRIVVGVTGATGTIYAVKLLEAMKQSGEVKTHLIMSEWAVKNMEIETDYSLEYIHSLATEVHDNNNLGDKLASGSFLTDGTVIIPCSMKTLASIACGYNDTLISRVAEVAMKEGRKLVICPRETPLSAIHLENMLKLSRLGAGIVPPMPAFYNNPASIDDIVNHHVMKVLDYFRIEYNKAKRWNG